MREDLRTEFKREWKNEYFRNIAAFANTEGGTLYLGMDNHGNAVGIGKVEIYHLIYCSISPIETLGKVFGGSSELLPKELLYMVARKGDDFDSEHMERSRPLFGTITFQSDPKVYCNTAHETYDSNAHRVLL